MRPEDRRPLADRFGTPVYVYELDAVTAAWERLVAALPDPSTILYSLKANPHPGLARHLRELGAGVEASSVGEVRAATTAGWSPDAILLTGPAKSEDVLVAAVAAGCRRFSVESVAERARLERVCRATGVEVRALLRVNVGLGGAGGGLAFGGGRSPFGMTEAVVLAARSELVTDGPVAVEGIHTFLATNVASLGQLRATLLGALAAAVRLRDAGVPVRRLDLGGGFGAAYAGTNVPEPLDGLRADLEDALDAGFPGWRIGDPEVTFESGRHLVGPAGTLLARVVEVKDGDVPIVVLDTGIHHLGGMSGLGRVLPLRPALLHQHPGPTRPTRVVGPLCTSLDCWAPDAELPALAAGDVIAVPDVGAYGLSASLVAFLSHDAPIEVLLAPDGVTSASRLTIDRTELGLTSPAHPCPEDR